MGVLFFLSGSVLSSMASDDLETTESPSIVIGIWISTLTPRFHSLSFDSRHEGRYINSVPDPTQPSSLAWLC